MLQWVLEIGLSGLQKMGEEVGLENRKKIFWGVWGRREVWGCIYYETVKD